MAGTTIEWYDYFLYATAAALIFAPQFFPTLSPLAGQLAAFSTFAVGFVARPLGGVIMGHFGDRVGRKSVLIVSLLTMGAATCLIGLLPNYDAVGIWAPILLVILRLIQGLSAGGEWGGAALMAVEHAPAHRRGISGAFAQLGTPLGIIASTLVFLLVRLAMDEAQFVAWGWRIPFLLSATLIVPSLYIRLKVLESPVFTSVRKSGRTERVPVVKALRNQPRHVLIATATFYANSTMGYLFQAYLANYVVAQLGFDRNLALVIMLVGASVWLACVLLFGALSDVIGRRNAYLIGSVLVVLWAFPLFWLVDTGTLALVILAEVVLVVGVAATHGPQAALYAELFEPGWRYSGASLSYALGALLGGGFAPLISTSLFAAYGSSTAISVYLLVVALIGLAGALAIPAWLGKRDVVAAGATASA